MSTPEDYQTNRCFASMDRHQRRREKGIPTVSTLVGRRDQLTAVWPRWSASRATTDSAAARRYVAPGLPSGEQKAVVASPKEIAGRWTDELIRDGLLWRLACQHAARRMKESTVTFQGRLTRCTPHQLQRLLQTGQESENAVACELIPQLFGTLIGAVTVEELSDPRWTPADVAVGRVVAAWADDLPRLTHLAEFVRWAQAENFTAALPSLAIDLALDHDAAEPSLDELTRAVQLAVKIATSAPQLPIALWLEPDVWNRLWSQLPDRFEKAAANESVIEIETRWQPADVSPLSLRPDTASYERRWTQLIGSRPDSSARKLLQDAVALWEEAAGTIQSETIAETDGAPFRSAAEAYLYALLQHHGVTRNLFVPGGDPGFSFGNRAAEVDLLCPKWKVAVEVDGYYHFCDPDGYRRDRRKDFLFQQHQFFVLRFLARDVVERMEDVLHAIVAAVRWQQNIRTKNEHENDD